MQILLPEGKNSCMSYSSHTFEDKNSSKRWLQKTRLKHSFFGLKSYQLNQENDLNIIDWGGKWRTL